MLSGGRVDRVAGACRADGAKIADDAKTAGDAKAAGADKAKCVGEGDIVKDFDPAAGEGLKRERVTCEALSI